MSPWEEFGKKCGFNKSTMRESNYSCEGCAGTQYSNRAFEHGRPGVDFYTPGDFYHNRENSMSKCPFPPYWNKRHLCDLYALPDLDTESLKVQGMLCRYIELLFEVGVGHF